MPAWSGKKAFDIRGHAKSPINASFIVCFAATLGLAVLCVAQLDHQRRERYEHVVSNDANIVAALSTDIAHMIELYDLSIRGVIDDLKLPQVKALDADLQRLVVFDHTLKNSYSGALQLMDKAGAVVLDSNTKTPTEVNYSDRDFFQVHAQNQQQGLFISPPFTSSDGTYAIALSRPVLDERGEFAGVVVGTVELGYFNEIFHALKISTRSAVTLYRTDGIVLMRMPFKAENIGRSIAKGGVFDLYPANRTGAFEFLAAIDGIQRVYNFSQVGDFPLLLNLGVPTDEIYAGWLHDAAVIGISLLALFGLTLMSWLTLQKELRLRHDMERQLEDRANTDGLTGLTNRRMFDEIGIREWRRAEREKTSIALLMIDADRFKLYNDAHGHQGGDKALQHIAQCISECTRRAGDLNARYGGEEFAVLLPNTEGTGALEVAERIRSLIHVTSRSAITVSIGVSSIVPREGLSLADLIKWSDEALYEAKEAGRNRTAAQRPLSHGMNVVQLSSKFRG